MLGGASLWLALAVSAAAQPGAVSPDWEQEAWKRGTLLYSQDRHREALEQFEKITAAHPDNGGALAFEGLCRFELAQYPEALAALSKARDRGVGDNPAFVSITRYTLAVLLSKFERFEAARRELFALADPATESDQLIRAMGIAVLFLPYLPAELPPGREAEVGAAGRAAWLQATRQTERASQAYADLVERYPNTPNVHYARAMFLMDSNPDQGLAEFRKEIEVNASNVPARLQLVSSYLKDGAFDAALPLVKEAVELAPEGFLPRLLLGRTLAGLDKPEQAVAELSRAVDLMPDSPDAHFALARALQASGKQADADREMAEFKRLRGSAK